MELYDIMKQLRKENKLTIDALAREMGISRQRLSNYENGVTDPPLSLAKAIFVRLGSDLFARR